MPVATMEVRVHPRARRNDVIALDCAIKVYVTAAPEGGRANEAVLRLLARRLGVQKLAVEILSGERSRSKVLSIDGLGEDEIPRRLCWQIADEDIAYHH